MESLRFAVPEPPPNIDPAPAPETMFVPEETTQPVVDSVEQIAESAPERETSPTSDQEGAPAQPSQNPPQTAAPEATGSSDRAAWVIQVASLSYTADARRLRDQIGRAHV